MPDAPLPDPIPTAPGAGLSRSTLKAARQVLHAYREGWFLDGRLAAVARMAADDARLRGAPAERMLVALKREWAALDEVRQLAAHDARALLDRLVTHFVRAYYDRAAPRGPEPQPPGRERRAA